MSDNKHQNQRPHGMRMGGGPGAFANVGQKPKNFKGTVARLLAFMKPYRLGLVAVFILTVIAVAAQNMGPRILGFATNELVEGAKRMTEGAGGIDFGRIATILTWLGIFYLLSALFNYLQSFIISGISQKTMYALRRSVDQKLRRLPLSYFDRNTFGDILSRVTNDVDTVSTTLQQGVTQILNSLLTLLTILVMMLVVSPWLSLVVLLIIPLTILSSFGIIKRSQGLFRGQQSSLGEINGHIEEMYTGQAVIKAFGREPAVTQTFDAINDKLYGNAWRAQFWSSIIFPLTNFLANLGYVIATVGGCILVIMGRLRVGDVQSFIQYLRNFTQPITQIANLSNQLQSTVAAAERIFEFLDETEEMPEAAAPVAVTDLKGTVDFSHVKFGYNPAEPIIQDFSLDVPEGSTVAIVGPTGAGKTTLVNLMLRFYDTQSGSITIGGQNIMDMRRQDLRSLFGMVLQDTWLFHGTIMENIRYGRLNATDEEVIEAAKAAHAHEFIASLPGGYQMELGEDASNISQGQRQLLTIARAILSNPHILILDEATSSVDTRTEVLIQKAMKNLMKGRTNFVIAHRLSTIRDADSIIVLNEGDIVETGRHGELLELGGFYASLYNSQFAFANAS